MLRALKRKLKEGLRRAGYRVLPAEEWGWDSENLRSLCPDVDTIIDVGVGFGTPALYEAFPRQYKLLIEPLPDFEQALRKILDDQLGSYELTAVGARTGVVTLNVDPERLQRASGYRRTKLTAIDDYHERQVPVKTLDEVVVSAGVSGPFGIKIDTEGAELEVLQGADRVLQETRFVIAEVSIAKRFESSYRFEQFIQAMDHHGFSLKDVLSLERRRGIGAVLLDALFVRE